MEIRRANIASLQMKIGVRVGNRTLIEDCRYRISVTLWLKEGGWQLVVSNSYELAIDPFSLCQRRWQDPSRLDALFQGQSSE